MEKKNMQVTNKNLCLFLNLARILYGVLSSYLIQENAQLFLFFYVIVHVGFLKLYSRKGHYYCIVNCSFKACEMMKCAVWMCAGC